MSIRFIATLALITITLCTLAQQKPPVVQDDYATATAGIEIAVNVLENDYGMQGHKIRIFHAVNAQLTHNDSVIFYTPPISLSGQKMLKYVLIDEDNGLYSEVGYLWIDVTNNTSKIIDNNNISARINANGVHFLIPGEPGDSHFYVPKNTLKSTFTAMNLWVGGLDSNNYLHFAGGRYQLQGRDFFPGPVLDQYDNSYINQWSRVWKVSRSEIEYHKSNWWKNNYNPTTTITTWPAHGDEYKRSVGLIAPFEDVNGNGIYDPMEGDYPVIKGDQAIFFVLNDDMLQHTESYGRKLGIEVHGMVYAYDCQYDSALQHTLFINYTIENKSNTTYHSTYFGFFADMSIGFADDDYMQSDVKRNSLIGLNGDDYDGMGYTETEYGDHPPAQSITILKGPRMDSDGMDNPSRDFLGNMLCNEGFNGMNFQDGIIDNECHGLSYSAIYKEYTGYASDPLMAADYYRNMQAMWRDQTKFQYGRDGHINSGAEGPDCRYMYPGKSDTVNWGTNGISPYGGYNANAYFWTENSNGNIPGDRRGNISTGPVTFKPGDVQEIEIALVFGRDYQNTGKMAALDILEDRIDKIIEYYQIDSFCCEPPAFNSEARISENNIEVFSSNNSIHIVNPENLKGLVQVFSTNGQLLLENSLNGCSNQEIPMDVSTGYYMLKVVGDGFLVSRKVFI